MENQKKFLKLKYLISTIVKSLMQIGFVLVIFFLFIFIFAIIGKSAFADTQYSHCVADDNDIDQINIAQQSCGEIYSCPENYKCVTSDETFTEGYADFDHLAYAMLAIFQISSLDGWGKIMRTMEDGYSQWFSIVFHMVCVLICGCFIMNLSLPILREHYFIDINKSKEDHLKKSAINKRLVRIK